MTQTLTRTAPEESSAAARPTCATCGDAGPDRFADTLGVCPECGRHQRLTAPERLATLLDGGSMRPLAAVSDDSDPLAFVDSQPYRERLGRARRDTGLADAAVSVTGTVEGAPVVAVAMDFRFLGGSLGAAVGELISTAAETALRTRTPLLIVTASGGARMQEGAISLMQMAKTCAALAALDDAGVLSVALVTDPTYGGVAASFATACDVVIAEPGARLGFAGPRVIEQTIKQRLPEGFQTAEFLFEGGLLDRVTPRHELRRDLGRLLAATAPGAGPRAGRAPADPPVVTDPEQLDRGSAWETVRRARVIARPTTLDYIEHLVDDFVELHGDRVSADCPAIVGGVGRLAGRSVVVIGHQKGHKPAELVARRFGMPSPAGYRKANRLMRLAAKLGLPVVTLVDTPGAHPGIEAERGGQAMAIADNLRLMVGLPVPIVSVVIGEGGSGGALALAVADRVLMLSNAVYSVISPEGCAAILWNDPAAAPRAAEALRVDASSLLELGVVDGVIPEPEGGSQADHAEAAARLGAAVTAELAGLTTLPAGEIVPRRRARYRAFGVESAR